jgi:hypothetical protein
MAGMELMKEAELFFLDEPTSGLDSASSMLVINALHFLASRGVTVSTTIHQPRQEILNLMDNLVLLAPGGRVAYYGPLIDVHAHFSSLHYTCPPGTNIADFVMDVLCGFVPLDNCSEVQQVQSTIDYICDWWVENKYPEYSHSNSLRAPILKQLSSIDNLIAVPPPKGPVQCYRFLRIVQLWKIFWTCYCRQERTNYRTMQAIATTCGLVLVFGCIVAFLIGALNLDGTGGGVSRFSAQITSGGLVFALLVQASSLRLFAHDHLLRDREFKAGVSVFPYYLGKLLGNYCEYAFYAFSFLVGYYPFLKARAPFIWYLYTFLLLHMAIAGLVNFIAIAYPGTNKGTFAVGVVVLLWSFGGVSPPLGDMENSMGFFATIVNYISPFKYSFTVEIINELSQYPELWEVDTLYEKLGYMSTDHNRAVYALIIYFVVTNVLAYVVAEAKQVSPKQRRAIAERIRTNAKRIVHSVSARFKKSRSLSSDSPSYYSADGSPDLKSDSGHLSNNSEHLTDRPLPAAPSDKEGETKEGYSGHASSSVDGNSARRIKTGAPSKTVRWTTDPVNFTPPPAPDAKMKSPDWVPTQPAWDIESQGMTVSPPHEESPDSLVPQGVPPPPHPRDSGRIVELAPLRPEKKV